MYNEWKYTEHIHLASLTWKGFTTAGSRKQHTNYCMWIMLLSPLDQEPCQAPLAQHSFTQPQSNRQFQLGLGQDADGAVRFTNFWSRSGGPQPKFKAGRCNASVRQPK